MIPWSLRGELCMTTFVGISIHPPTIGTRNCVRSWSLCAGEPRRLWLFPRSHEWNQHLEQWFGQLRSQFCSSQMTTRIYSNASNSDLISEWSGCLFFRLHVGNAGTRYHIDSLCGCYRDNGMNSMKGASEKSLRPVRSQDARTKLWQRPVSRAEPSIFIVRDLDGDTPNIGSHKKNSNIMPHRYSMIPTIRSEWTYVWCC